MKNAVKSVEELDAGVDTSTPSAKQRKMRAIGPPHSASEIPFHRSGTEREANDRPGPRTKTPQEKKIGPPPIAEIEVLWITAGLGCDGDTIAMTAATQPSIEEVVLGALPWIPKVNLHNPFLAAANGDDFLRPFHQAAEGKIENFILVVEGSIPNEHNKEEGYWASLGTDPKTGQPIPTCDWIDRLARQGLGGGGGGNLRHLRRHSRHGGQSHGVYGSSRLPGLAMEVEGVDSHRVRSGLSGAAR